VNIILSGAEMLVAAVSGAMRLISAEKKKLTPTAHGPRDWNYEIEGAMAEVAFAKFRKAYFDPSLNWFGLKDVDGYGVRHTGRADGCLIIRPEDGDGKYALVTGGRGRYRVAGWQLAEEVKGWDECYKTFDDNREPAWFAPQDRLHQWADE